jgi:hypothetical protein
MISQKSVNISLTLIEEIYNAISNSEKLKLVLKLKRYDVIKFAQIL